MGPWFWLNIPPAAAFLLACSGIPLWLVLRHPAPDRMPDQDPGDIPPAPERLLSRPCQPRERQPIPG